MPALVMSRNNLHVSGSQAARVNESRRVNGWRKQNKGHPTVTCGNISCIGPVVWQWVYMPSALLVAECHTHCVGVA